MRAIALVLGLFASAAAAADFSADLEIREGDTVSKGRIFVSGGRYRMELTAPLGPDLVVIVDPEAKIARLLVPRYKAYVEMPSDDPQLRSRDPFLAVKTIEERFSCRAEGAATVESYDCTKEIIHHEDTDIVERWTCAKLGFPLKIVMLAREGDLTSLTNIREEAVAADLFAVPAGYAASTLEAIGEKVDADPEMQAKSEAYEQSRPRTSRLSLQLEAGGENRVLLAKGTTVRGAVLYCMEEPCTWYVVPCAGGKELVERAACTIEGTGKADFLEGLEPDVLVAGASRGVASLDLRLTGRGTLILAKSRAFLMAGGARGWSASGAWTTTLTVTAALEEGSPIERVKGNLRVTRGKGENAQQETIELPLAQGESRTFTFTADDNVTHLDLTLMAGRVKVVVVEDGRPAAEQKPF